MRLSLVVEAGMSRRDFLRRGASAALSVSPLMKLFAASGVSSSVVSGLQAGKTVPFLIDVVSWSKERNGPPLSHYFYQAEKVADFSKRLSDSDLIFGSGETYGVGGGLGLDKFAAIVRAASDGSTVNLAGVEYRVEEDDYTFDLFPVGGVNPLRERFRTADGMISYVGDCVITVYKDDDMIHEFFAVDKWSGDAIRDVWDNFLKAGGTHIDRAGAKLIKDRGLDMSDWGGTSDERDAYKYEDDYDWSEEEEEEEKEEARFSGREFYGSMHQVFEGRSFDVKLDRVLGY